MLPLECGSIGHNVAGRRLVGELHASHLLNACHKLTCSKSAHCGWILALQLPCAFMQQPAWQADNYTASFLGATTAEEGEKEGRGEGIVVGGGIG